MERATKSRLRENYNRGPLLGSLDFHFRSFCWPRRIDNSLFDMTPKAFFDLVSRLREAQKEYFKTRSSAALKVSKKLEKELDEEISRVNNILDAKRQPKLF